MSPGVLGSPLLIFCWSRRLQYDIWAGVPLTVTSQVEVPGGHSLATSMCVGAGLILEAPDRLPPLADHLPDHVVRDEDLHLALTHDRRHAGHARELLPRELHLDEAVALLGP